MKEGLEKQLPDADDLVSLVGHANALAALSDAITDDFMPYDMPGLSREVGEMQTLIMEAANKLIDAANVIIPKVERALKRRAEKHMVVICELTSLDSMMALAKYDPDAIGSVAQRNGAKPSSRSEAASVFLNRQLISLHKQYMAIE